MPPRRRPSPTKFRSLSMSTMLLTKSILLLLRQRQPPLQLFHSPLKLFNFSFIHPNPPINRSLHHLFQHFPIHNRLSLFSFPFSFSFSPPFPFTLPLLFQPSNQ